MIDGRKVLITGHTGQVGSRVAGFLALRCELWGLARYSAPGSLEAAEKLGVRPLKGDLGSGELDGIPDGLDYVIHFAASTYPATHEEGLTQNSDACGFLMHRCREAKAFLHVSTTGVYSRNPDPHHRYREDDPLGSQTDYAPFYGGTKAAGEAVVRAFSRTLGLPATIARMNVAYGGAQGDGGLPGKLLDAVLKGDPVRIPKSYPRLQMPIHEDDIARQVEPLLAVAEVGGNIVNWSGDDVVNVEDMARYLGELTGVEPKFERTDDGPAKSQGVVDTTKRMSLIGPCRVDWRDGFRRMAQARTARRPIKS